MATVTEALIYTRVSSDEQAREGQSLEVQRREAIDYAARNSWSVAGIYTDVMSGTRDDRPEYSRLLEDVRAAHLRGRRVVVVVAALDRFGRKLLERVRCREALRALGVATHSVRDGGEVSDLVANVLAAVAQEEVRRLGERVSASRQHASKLGWMPVGEVAWGYRWREATPDERAAGAPRKVLDIDPLAAPYVQEAFRRIVAGESARSVARWIDTLPESAKDINRSRLDPTRERSKQKMMRLGAVISMLRCATYVARPRRHDEPDILKRPVGRWPALVDDTTFAEVQRRLEMHPRYPRQASGRHLLTGIARCRCGKRLQHTTTRNRTPRLRCQALVGCGAAFVYPTVEREVTARVTDLLDGVLNDREFRAALADAWEEVRTPARLGDHAEQIAALRQIAGRARERLVRATELLADRTIDKDAYDGLRVKAHADLDAAEAEIIRLGAQMGPATPTLPDLDTVLRRMADWQRAFRETEPASRREVLTHLIERVVPRHTDTKGQYEIAIKWTPEGDALVAALKAFRAQRAA